MSLKRLTFDTKEDVSVEVNGKALKFCYSVPKSISVIKEVGNDEPVLKDVVVDGEIIRSL